MAQHSATIRWERAGAKFTDNRYSRTHRWTFDGGLSVPASAAPGVVPPPLSDPAAVDPEEAFVASLSSCHMLWFLYLAAKRGFVVESYVDQAVGDLGKDAEGRMCMTRVVLRPSVAFSGAPVPDPSTLTAMHDEAHHLCYVANSVRTPVTIEPT